MRPQLKWSRPLGSLLLSVLRYMNPEGILGSINVDTYVTFLRSFLSLQELFASYGLALICWGLVGYEEAGTGFGARGQH